MQKPQEKGNKKRLPIFSRTGNPTEDSSFGRNMIRFKTISRRKVFIKRKMRKGGGEARGARIRGGEG